MMTEKVWLIHTTESAELENLEDRRSTIQPIAIVKTAQDVISFVRAEIKICGLDINDFKMAYDEPRHKAWYGKPKSYHASEYTVETSPDLAVNMVDRMLNYMAYLKEMEQSKT